MFSGLKPVLLVIMNNPRLKPGVKKHQSRPDMRACYYLKQAVT